MPLSSTKLLVFARAPVAGHCKTRLIPTLGAQGAARLHRQLTKKTLALARASGLAVELWCTPSPTHGFFLRERAGLRLRRQPGGDLGRRMGLALQGAAPALLIGTDCPSLITDDLRAAVSALESHDVVLQPATDGGFVLIGARALSPHALQGIAWSSGRELKLTRLRLQRLGLRVALLETRSDLDTPADLRRARRAGWVG